MCINIHVVRVTINAKENIQSFITVKLSHFLKDINLETFHQESDAYDKKEKKLASVVPGLWGFLHVSQRKQLDYLGALGKMKIKVKKKKTNSLYFKDNDWHTEGMHQHKVNFHEKH